jgi:hypothetical protein
MKTVKIYYDSEGTPISDFEIDSTLDNVKDNDVIHTSSHLVILAARVLHKQQKIRLVLYVNKNKVPVDKNGTLKDFDDIIDDSIYYMNLI